MMADIRGINIEARKAVQIVRDMVGYAPCTSVIHCAAVEFASCSVCKHI